MVYLADTGVLVRLFNRADANFQDIRGGLWRLREKGHTLAVSIQNVAEFWNVCTRPAMARGGYGLTPAQTEKRLRVVERMCSILPETDMTYRTWRNLVSKYSVQGRQVHDARLVAWMLTQGISQIITLNVADFARYPEIAAISPATMAQLTRT